MCARKRSSDTYEFPFLRLARKSSCAEESFSSAVGQMSTSDLIDFVRKFPELADDLMKSLLEYLEEISSEYKYRKSRRASSVYEFDRVGRLPMLIEKC